MTSLYSLHWIPEHRSGDDKTTIAKWNPPYVKLVSVDERPPYTEDVPAGAKIIIRNHPMSENYNRGRVIANADDARKQAHEAAAACGRMATYLVSKGIPLGRQLYEFRNEWQLWAGEPPALVAIADETFLQDMHALGLHCVIGNFGVGWPGNGGVAGAPVDWAFYLAVIKAMQPGDYLGLHEYWSFAGPSQNWRWWAGRYLQCPWDVPILITETGIDAGVEGKAKQGWLNLPGASDDAKAATYCTQLAQYEAECRKDGRIQGLCIFTYDYGSRDWEKMSIRNSAFLAKFLPYVQAQKPITPPVVPPVVSGGDTTKATCYSQRDPRWASEQLGTAGGLTIGQAGCAMTSLASVLMDYDITTRPDMLNSWLAMHGGYSNGNLLNWASVSRLGVALESVKEYALVPAPMDAIRAALAAGKAVIVQLDFNPGGALQTHFARCLSVSADGKDCDLMDPWTGEIVKLSARYAAPGWDAARAIFAVVIYHKC